ncbi:MAG: hypothetical protein FWC00_02610, partial [Firmicutes bacterium]|nr:hypothetical protein [Bacillota bacterium]
MSNNKPKTSAKPATKSSAPTGQAAPKASAPAAKKPTVQKAPRTKKPKRASNGAGARFWRKDFWNKTRAIVALCLLTVFLIGAIVGGYFIFRPFRASPMVVTGFDHTVVLRRDGTVWAWGRNEEGQLGNNNRRNQFTPVRVLREREPGGSVVPMTNITQIASHKIHTLALRNTGLVYSMGWNEEGQLGADVGCSLVAIQVRNLRDVVQIDAGMLFSIALTRSGYVYAWGRNRMGTVGYENIDDQHRAQRVMGLSNITAISAGHEHVLALHQSGHVYAWGRNRNGQVGCAEIDPETINPMLPAGTFFDIRPPMRIPNLSNVIQVA